MNYPSEWTSLQEFIHLSKYSRWQPTLGRRESWDETVDRWGTWAGSKVDFDVASLTEAVRDLSVMPSMRSLMAAGPAADRDSTCVFNCSYLELDSPIAMAELLFILMCGTGVGYSVEQRVIDRWPICQAITRDESVIIQVKDSKQGWADAVKALMSNLLNGIHPTWDISLVRPAGALLKTFGGRASGPAPLEDAMRFITNKFYKAQDRRFRPIEVHDIACVIANAVIVGGVRRSAMISLSDLNDQEMARAKSGNWWELHGYRALANNSAVHTSRPTPDVFMSESIDMYRSNSGERGIFNREAAKLCADTIGRPSDHHFGTNPCGEITLRPMSFCNLSEVVVRKDDTFSTIARKIEKAVDIGMIQATQTHFPYLRKAWTDNAEEERLLGVSLTGMHDGPNELMWDMGCLEGWKEIARTRAVDRAAEMGINIPHSITTVKPSGTVSILVDSSSGIHERWSQFYIRRVRMDKKDPLCQLMIDQGVPGEDEVNNPLNTYVFEFPVGVDRQVADQSHFDASAQLDLWSLVKECYTEHNPSVTITYTEDDFLPVMNKLYSEYWDIAQGLSFLPKQDAVYKQAPLEAISREQWEVRRDAMPVIDWSKLTIYENSDNTVGQQTLACVGNSCELPDTK